MVSHAFAFVVGSARAGCLRLRWLVQVQPGEEGLSQDGGQRGLVQR